MHRLFYFLYNNSINPNLILLHSCDTPLCVNPAHLSEGTPMDNKRDSIQKGRHYHPNLQQLPLIKEAFAECKNYNKVARDFGLNSGTVWSLLQK